MDDNHDDDDDDDNNDGRVVDGRTNERANEAQTAGASVVTFWSLKYARGDVQRSQELNGRGVSFRYHHAVTQNDEWIKVWLATDFLKTVCTGNHFQISVFSGIFH